MDQAVGLQLLQGGAEGLEGDAPDVPLHLIEPDHAEVHQRVENEHLVLPLDQGHGVVEAGLLQIGVLNTGKAHQIRSF